MRMRTTALLAAGSIGLVFAGSSAALADPCGAYGGYDPPAAVHEQVIVNSPVMRTQTGRLNSTMGRVSLSQPVQFADLNLCTGEGAAVLRERVRIAANNVCKQLEGMYPHAMPGSTSCYHDAVDNGMTQVNNAIGDARGLR
jgi:UrcA family protein